MIGLRLSCIGDQIGCISATRRKERAKFVKNQQLDDFHDLLKKLIALCESDQTLRDSCVTLGVYGAKLVELQELLLGFDLRPHMKILRVRVDSTGAAIEFGGLPAEIEATKYLKSSKVIPSFTEGHALEFDDEASGMPSLNSEERWGTTKKKIVFLAKHWLDFQFKSDCTSKPQHPSNSKLTGQSTKCYRERLIKLRALKTIYDSEDSPPRLLAGAAKNWLRRDWEKKPAFGKPKWHQCNNSFTDAEKTELVQLKAFLDKKWNFA